VGRFRARKKQNQINADVTIEPVFDAAGARWRSAPFKFLNVMATIALWRVAVNVHPNRPI